MRANSRTFICISAVGADIRETLSEAVLMSIRQSKSWAIHFSEEGKKHHRDREDTSTA
jgi:hypothetical protein